MTDRFLPELPEAITPLERLLGNLWWSWTPAARALVESIDPVAWRAHRGRVSAFAASIPRSRWDELAADPEFLGRLETLDQMLDDYEASGDTWWHRNHFEAGASKLRGVAYFSMEFGIHESLPIYSGGLGVLAGDHIKSASDLGVPFVGLGLFYRFGYFRQSIHDGRQHEDYPEQTPTSLGLTRAIGAGGQPLQVFVPIAGHNVRAIVWEARVGRTRLYLLDTNVPGNSDWDRALTHNLYGGDATMRIRQEALLGLGGVRVLRGLGRNPDVLHLNEGHCAFVTLERIREELERGADFETAHALVKQQCVFTTHTPVPAGHDRFWQELVDEVLWPFRNQLGLGRQELMDLGRETPGSNQQFCMTVLAMRGARATNGVSAKHGEVSRAMWAHLWPELPVDEVPITHITNGVHAPSWLGVELQALLGEHLGPDWQRRLTDPARMTELDELDLGSLWSVHAAQKRRLIQLVAARTGTQLDPNALLLGFARRFATYKRGDLILSDLERTIRFMADSDRPVNLLYAGKAHPRDEHGKDIVARVLAAAGHPELAGRVVFLPDYDIGIGRALVQGVDVWVNNPRRPREASGTSGQKVSMNGGLNCSTLDGWWLEGYELEPLAGWAVGSPDAIGDVEAGDRADREALYRIVEEQIVPLFYDRGEDGLPQAWLERCRAAIASCLPAFNTDRMVGNYAEFEYLAGR